MRHWINIVSSQTTIRRNRTHKQSRRLMGPNAWASLSGYPPAISRCLHLQIFPNLSVACQQGLALDVIQWLQRLTWPSDIPANYQQSSDWGASCLEFFFDFHSATAGTSCVLTDLLTPPRRSQYAAACRSAAYQTFSFQKMTSPT